MRGLISGPRAACYQADALSIPVVAERPKPEPETNLPRAAAFMMLAALLFASMSVTVKLLSRTLPNAMVVFVRCGLSLLVLMPTMLRGGLAPLRTRHLPEHIARGALGMAGMYCFFFAIARLGSAEALLLNYSLPLFLPFVERAWLGAPVPRGIWRPLTIGLLGLLLILKPGLGLFQPAALVGLLGALFAAGAQVGVRRLTLNESVTKIVFYFSASSTLIALGPALFSWVTPRLDTLPLALAMMACGTLAQLAMTRAYQLAPAARVGPFIYGSVAFAAVFDWVLFARHPDLGTSLGTALVVAAGVSALRGAVRPRGASPRLEE
jgi:drug/metabolite transporter (DMT)-like permease